MPRPDHEPPWSLRGLNQSFRSRRRDVRHWYMDVNEKLIEVAAKHHCLVDRKDVATVMTSGQWCRRLNLLRMSPTQQMDQVSRFHSLGNIVKHCWGLAVRYLLFLSQRLQVP